MIENVLSYMLLDENNRSLQRIQSQHRINLVEFWQVQPGERILEIGCGQGDTTAVLAEYVGPTGKVVAIDIAEGDYGAPYTLAQATDKLLASPIGERLTFLLATDILDEKVSFASDAFDKVIISHCSWYFADQNTFSQLLAKVKNYSPTLCYAEWNPSISKPNQMAHLYAALIQSQYHIFAQHAEANIRTLITPTDVHSLMQQQQLHKIKEISLSDTALQDGSWEVAYTGQDVKNQILADRQLNSKAQQLLLSQINQMQQYAANGLLPLDIYASVWQRR